MTKQQAKPLRLALIGMSGAGKSFWTKKLAVAGWATLSCDDRIEDRLRPQLAAQGHAGIGGVAAWMGWPDSPHYAQREAQYLAAEIAVIEETLSGLEARPERGLVLDTTGSVIHAGEKACQRLRRLMTVVYLAASMEEQRLLIDRYLTDPKPVLWRGTFRPHPGETPLDTVRRCYPVLIAERRSKYEALAHGTIPMRALRDASLDAAAFLSLIERERRGQEAGGAF
jgi:shikimate kinase